MGFIKWIGYLLVSTIGLCALTAIFAFLWIFGTVIGTVLLGVLVIVVVAEAIKEYYEDPDNKDA